MTILQHIYITKLKDKNISIKNEIKEAIWINKEYERNGIKCNPTLSLKIIPDLINDSIW